MSRNWRDIEDYEERHVARRQQDMRPHVIYRFDSSDGKYCYIGVTSNLKQRIHYHRSNEKRPLHRFLKKCSSKEAETFFTVIDTEARGFAKAEQRETTEIKAAFFDAEHDRQQPWPLNQRTHDISVERFKEIIRRIEEERDIPREELERQIVTEAERREEEEKKRRKAEEGRDKAERQARAAAEEQKEAQQQAQREAEKRRRAQQQQIAVLFTTLFITTLSLIIFFAVSRLQSPPPDPTHTPTLTLTSSPIPPPPGTPFNVIYDGSMVRACASRECDSLGTLSADARILVYRQDEGECIRGNCTWLVFEFAGQEAYLHSSLAVQEQSPRPTRTPRPTYTPTPFVEEQARVLRVVDGDTIQVSMGGKRYGVRYIGVDSPDGGGICYQEAKEANARLVVGRTVALVRDVSDSDRYDRLLRYVYVDSTFVNAALVRDGFAENSVWEPDTRFAGRFRALEEAARAANRGCHPSGVFDDGDPER